MDLLRIAPLIENIIKEQILAKKYPFGVKKKMGNKFATGFLYNSIQAIPSNDQTRIEIWMAEYAASDTGGSVNSGTPPGTDVSVQDLIVWLKARKIKARDEKGRYTRMTLEELAYIIKKSIKRFGIKAAPFLDYSIDEIIKDGSPITDLLGDMTVDDLIAALDIKSETKKP